MALCLASPRAFAGPAEITETLSVVWEVFWQQQGYVQPVSKWRDPIRISFSGVAFERHKPFALGELPGSSSPRQTRRDRPRTSKSSSFRTT